MLLSIAVILLSGLLLGTLCKKIRFPSLFGMIIAGIIIGPYVLDLIDSSILNISSEIRRIALIIILIRAGLKLDLSDLKKVGRPAILMCFVPACFEIVGMVILAPVVFGMNRLDAAILGAVIGAVSPAVIVPRMIRLIDEGYGKDKGIPQMILAGASVDDVFVIVMFTTFTGLAQGESVSVMSFVNIPISILLGILIGALAGYVLYKWFVKTDMSLILMTVILLSVSFLLSAVETGLTFIPFASLIAIMCVGTAIRRSDTGMAVRISGQYDKLWTVAEIFLFVLVGASVAVDHLKEAGITAILLILLVLLFRMLGVFICIMGTDLNIKEKLFCMIAYTPKATVQAAIGGLPLAMGLPCGEIVLTISVVAILLTAPLGAFGIDLTYRRFLKADKE
ncbi:MAG: cation:proton antiporter [Lachnospiraceae bacterium]|nr:cation:proton antiporter [Lachnospiraceae bacterium]